MAERHKAKRRATKAEKLRDEANERARQRTLARHQVERVAQTAGGINSYAERFVNELELAMTELLRSSSDVSPLRRIAYVTRELKSYADMVKRDREAANG